MILQHRCDAMRNEQAQALSDWRLEHRPTDYGVWYLSIEDHVPHISEHGGLQLEPFDASIAVTHCPFCGEKLDAATERKRWQENKLPKLIEMVSKG